MESIVIGILGLILNLGGFVYMVRPEMFSRGDENRIRLRGLVFFLVGAGFVAFAYSLRTSSH